jgi:integrase
MQKRHRNDGVRKICACPVRAWAKCAHSWHFNYKWRGVHYRLSLDRELGKHIEGKTVAKREAERIRQEIRDGRFRAPLPLRDRLTLRLLMKAYREHLAVKRPGRSEVDKAHAALILRTVVPAVTSETRQLGDWLVCETTADTLERFRQARLAAGGGPVGINRNLGFLSAMWNWALEHDHVESTPFKKGTKTVVRKVQELPRSRRLEAGEDEKLLAACGPHLRALVEAAIETGCRQGELLSLQWWQVRGDPPTDIALPAAKTKTRQDRVVPLSTRMRAILEMRRLAPDGEKHPGGAHVFGNEIGQAVKSIGTAWDNAVLRAHGVTVERGEKTHALTTGCRAALRGINLHFHDLRREAGSRWLEGGVPIHVVSKWLGHTNVAQTSTYLATTTGTQADTMQRFEETRARLQKLATRGRKRHRNPPPTAGRTDGKPSKTAVGREAPSIH